jgi:peptide/nickel transport system substrate-binding protein
MSTVTGAGLKVVSTPSGSNMFVQFDPKKAKLSDPRVGQALNMAVDRASILKNIFKGQGFLTTSVDPSVSFIDPNLKPYPYDPAKAKQLLTDAGFDFNARLDMWIPIGYIPGSDSVAQAMASDYQKIGIKLNLISADFATWRTKYLGHTTGDALIMTTNPNYTYDPMYAYSGWVSCASTISYVCDPKLESQIQNIRPLAGQARVAAAHDFDKYLYDNPIGVYLMQWNQINATKSNLVVNQPRGFIYMSAADLSIKK